jgi:hypothetical protein
MAYKTEDHASLDAAVTALKERGFVKASAVSEHYRHPARMENGYFQRADVFVPFNDSQARGRISFWDAFA